MLNDLNEQNIIIEIKELIYKIDSIKNSTDVYCDLMKQIFLSSSGQN
jgi:hypothetical protein